MFTEVSLNSTKRLLEAKRLMELCSDDKFDEEQATTDSVLKGVVYVLLYGALEFTITHCVSRIIEILNDKTLNLYQVLPSLWGLIYDSACKRIETAGTNKKWENRYKLFKELTKDKVIEQIESTLFPSSNGNIKEQQLDRVWKTFGIKAPMFEPEHMSVKQTLLDLANGRMAVAHGRECASQIGSLKSSSDLEELYDSISRYCSYLIECFTQYINQEEYLQK
jgi:hypothetical protein